MRSRVNFVGRIKCDGRILKDPQEIKDEVAHFYEELYKGDNGTRPKLGGISFPLISSKACWLLEREFKEEKARIALEECDGDKALGSDNFNSVFIKAGWEFHKEDFVAMLSEFHRRDKINREMKATFLTLIPKSA